MSERVIWILTYGGFNCCAILTDEEYGRISSEEYRRLRARGVVFRLARIVPSFHDFINQTVAP